MIRGVSFKIPQIKGNILWQIFKCIDVKKYSWYNIENQNEAWEYINNSQGDVFLELNYYNGKNFLQKIQSNYYILFLKLQAYLGNDGFSNIHSYTDFQRSNCQLLLLLYDCEFVEIYIKDQAIIRDFFKNAIMNNYTEIEYITEKNDFRTKMDVL